MATRSREGVLWVLKKAILRRLAKVRLDVDEEGSITPVLLRLEAEGEPIVISSVDAVDDRITEVWYELSARGGERLVVRLVREGLQFTLHTVETEHPERWRGWSEVEQAEQAQAAAAPSDEEAARARRQGRTQAT